MMTASIILRLTMTTVPTFPRSRTSSSFGCTRSLVAITTIRRPTATTRRRSSTRNRRVKFRKATAWFRRFLVARTLFLSIELAMPFYSIHAATYHGNNSSGLNTFVIASSLGLVLGGVIWPRFDPRAIRLVLATAAIVTLAGGALALTIEMKPDLQTPFIYAPVFVLVAIGTQGISTGRTLFLTDAAADTERPFCIAVSNAVTGLIAVAVGAALGGPRQSARRRLANPVNDGLEYRRSLGGHDPARSRQDS
jgi:hypothetical protein